MAGIRNSIICVSFGLLTALAVNLALGTIVFLFKFPVPIIGGVCSAYIFAYLYGRTAGKIVYRTGANNFKVWLTGVLLAWSCVFSIAAVGSSYYFFKELNPNRVGDTFFDYIFKPTVWIMLFGFIPALLLGLLWAERMKKQLVSIK